MSAAVSCGRAGTAKSRTESRQTVPRLIDPAAPSGPPHSKFRRLPNQGRRRGYLAGLLRLEGPQRMGYIWPGRDRASRPEEGMLSKRFRNLVVVSAGLVVLGVLPSVLYRVWLGGVPQVSPAAAKRMLVDRPGSVLLVDVRTPREFAESHLRGAVSWPSSDILRLGSADGVPGPLQGKSLLLICQAGSRSVRAARHLRSLGLTDVFNVREGLVRWIGDAENPVGREFNVLLLADGSPAGLP